MTRYIVRKIYTKNFFFSYSKRTLGLNIYENLFSLNRKKIRVKPRNYLFPLPETVSLHCFTFFWLILLQSFIFEILWSRKSEIRSRKSEVGSRESEVGRSSSAFVRSSLLLRRFVFRKVDASEWWWTARDHGEATAAPSRLPLRAHFRRERETSGYQAGAGAIPLWPLAFCILYLR